MASLRIESAPNQSCNLFIFLDSSCLRCLQCFSNLSWKDCNKHAIKTNECKPPKVCYMSHRMFKRNGQQEHQFIKACYNPDWCPEEKCRETFERQLESSWCETKCCKDEDFCNAGMTRSWEKAYGGKAASFSSPSTLCLIMIQAGLLVLFMTAWIQQLLMNRGLCCQSPLFCFVCFFTYI